MVLQIRHPIRRAAAGAFVALTVGNSAMRTSVGVPKCKCAAIEEGVRDVKVQIHYDREMHTVECGRIHTPYCARCFHVIPDADAQIIIENKVREHLSLLLPGDILRAWSQEQFIGEGLPRLAERIGINLQMLERIMTYQSATASSFGKARHALSNPAASSSMH